MRQLACDARNIRHCITGMQENGDPEVSTLIEAVITVMVKAMEFSGAGMVQVEKLETIRFEMGVESARVLRDDIGKWIEDAERERERLGIK
jgi:hypothetical protein